MAEINVLLLFLFDVFNVLEVAKFRVTRLFAQGVSASTAAEMVQAWKRVCPNFDNLKVRYSMSM